MGKAMEILIGKAVNPGAALTALTMATGDSLTIRNFPQQHKAYLDRLWSKNAAGGVLRVRSPRLHDDLQGMRYSIAAGIVQCLNPPYASQRVQPQDILTVDMSGGGAETDIAGILVYYDDMPGVDARLFDLAEVKPRIASFTSAEFLMTSGATLGDYSATVPLTTATQALKANTDYAILGYEVNVSCAAWGLRGADTGNTRLGGPGTTDRIETRSFFIDQSKATGRPCIPVINSANAASTVMDVVDTAAATAITVELLLAQLRD